MTDARTEILARVRAALSQPTAASVRAHTAAGSAFLDEPLAARRFMPQVPADVPGRIARFAERSDALNTRFVQVADAEAASEELRRLAVMEGWSRVARHEAALLDQVVGGLAGLPQYVVGRETFDKRALAACDAGITTCECLIAQTGSVLVTPRQGGRALSVLPEHHIVIATVDELEPDLPAAWARLGPRGGEPGFAGLITGPSRTGDIERVLVLGAHGPKRLTIVLIGGSDV